MKNKAPINDSPRVRTCLKCRKTYTEFRFFTTMAGFHRVYVPALCKSCYIERKKTKDIEWMSWKDKQDYNAAMKKEQKERINTRKFKTTEETGNLTDDILCAFMTGKKSEERKQGECNEEKEGEKDND